MAAHSKRSPELDDRICERLANGEPLRQICRDEQINHVTVAVWRKNDPVFDERVKAARAAGFDAIAEDCLEIADDARNDWMDARAKDGDEKALEFNGEHVQRSKLRVWARLQLLAKWDPKRYGDAMTLRGDADNPLAIISDEQLLARTKANMAQLGLDASKLELPK